MKRFAKIFLWFSCISGLLLWILLFCVFCDITNEDEVSEATTSIEISDETNNIEQITTADTISTTTSIETIATTTSIEERETTVYISSTGTRYHNDRTCGNMENATAIIVAEARRLGYMPCQRCC